MTMPCSTIHEETQSICNEPAESRYVADDIYVGDHCDSCWDQSGMADTCKNDSNHTNND